LAIDADGHCYEPDTEQTRWGQTLPSKQFAQAFQFSRPISDSDALLTPLLYRFGKFLVSQKKLWSVTS
jgi:hypothetical protein